MQIPSANSCFRVPVPPTTHRTFSSSAPNSIEAPPFFDDDNDNDNEDNGVDTITKTPVRAYTERTAHLRDAIMRLQRDKTQLTRRIRRQVPLYGDEHLAQNLQRIHAIIEKALHDIMTESETSAHPIWRDAFVLLKGFADRYQKHLETCPGRRELQETQECLAQLEQLVKIFEVKTTTTTCPVCCVCQDATVNVSIACGHLLCSTCAQSVDKCPLCRTVVTARDIRHFYL